MNFDIINVYCLIKSNIFNLITIIFYQITLNKTIKISV